MIQLNGVRKAGLENDCINAGIAQSCGPLYVNHGKEQVVKIVLLVFFFTGRLSLQYQIQGCVLGESSYSTSKQRAIFVRMIIVKV